MSFFEYISVMVSVILALGIARILGGGFVLLGWASDNQRVQAVVVLASLLGFVGSFILRMTAGAFTPG